MLFAKEEMASPWQMIHGAVVYHALRIVDCLLGIALPLYFSFLWWMFDCDLSCILPVLIGSFFGVN